MNLGKKVSGGTYKKRRKKKLYEIRGQGRVVKLNKEEKKKAIRARGGAKKIVMLQGKYVNVLSEGHKSKRVEIKNVFETPSNRFLARQNIITKGTIVETELGKVRVTNRPSQEGVINGILVEEQK